jgi:hypothetical protein
VRAFVAAAIALSSLFACADEPTTADSEPVIDEAELYATLTGVRSAQPLLDGSAIVATVTVGALNRERAELVLVAGSDQLARLAPVAPLEFLATQAVVEAAETATSAYLDDGQSRTIEIPVSWAGAADLPVLLEPMSATSAYYNQAFVLRGAGMVAPSEGDLIATLVGLFTPTGGEPESVEVAGPCEPAEAFSRDRCVVRLPPQLGGLREGLVDARLSLRSTLLNGSSTQSDEISLIFDIVRPDVFGLSEDEIALGQTLTFSGGGFVVGGGYSTIITLEGALAGEAFVQELVMESAGGETAATTVRAVVEGAALVAADFGIARGEFVGTATARVTDGQTTLDGAPADLRFELVGVRQVVWLRFLPGFYGSLERFGLGAAAGAIEERVRERIAGIYDGFAVDVRTHRPTDFDLNHVARIDIGGPDPNGIGLFGYDNTPGKDVGNLRLFDVIGGENFETQLDGYPGYGGVFIESMLWWGSNPPVDTERPVRAPAVDAGFDAVFQAVFERAASPTEVSGVGDTDRVREVDAAITALANAIGETSAHELAHSLGLAQPDEANAFHNNGDSPGCLMDHGEDRPFGERAALPGRPSTRWCGDAEAYLQEILPL